MHAIFRHDDSFKTWYNAWHAEQASFGRRDLRLLGRSPKPGTRVSTARNILGGKTQRAARHVRKLPKAARYVRLERATQRRSGCKRGIVRCWVGVLPDWCASGHRSQTRRVQMPRSGAPATYQHAQSDGRSKIGVHNGCDRVIGTMEDQSGPSTCGCSDTMCTRLARKQWARTDAVKDLGSMWSTVIPRARVLVPLGRREL